MSGAIPTCPRCGYDQSGALRAEADAWPLETRCAECGLAIGWGAYFRSDATLPRQWIEHCRLRAYPLAWIRTVLVACIGRPLFSRLRLEHRIRWLRLALALVTLVVVAIVGLAISIGIDAWRETGTAIATRGRQVVYASPPRSPSDGWTQASATLEPIRPMERLQATLRLAFLPFDRSRPRMEGYATVPTEASAQAAFLAWERGESPPAFVMARQRIVAVILPGSPFDRWRGVLLPWRPILSFAAIACAASTATFLVLPIARRRAKVRWAQIARCTAYLALGCLPLAMVLLRTLFGGRRSPYGRYELLRGTEDDLVVLVPMIALLTLWWHAAAKRYLRMERPFAVAASVATIGTLAAAAIALA